MEKVTQLASGGLVVHLGEEAEAVGLGGNDLVEIVEGAVSMAHVNEVAD